MSSNETHLSRKLSMTSLRRLMGFTSLSKLHFTKSDSSSFTSTSSTPPGSSDQPGGLSQSANSSLCRDYPGQPGEEVQSRYILVRKLGKGSYSTVWLAKDLKQENYVAIKILTNRATQYHAMHFTDELSILKAISASVSYHTGASYCISWSNDFSLHSPYGEHLCLAFDDVLGLSLCDLRRRTPKHILPLRCIRRVFKQVLLALEYLHDFCEIVHTDLKPDSILVHLSDQQATIHQALERSHSPPGRRRNAHSSREYSIMPLSTPLDVLDDPNLKIKLIDFGHAQRISEHLTNQIQAPSLRAPEVILGYAWGTSIDIWSLGCILFELVTGQWLFQPKASSNWTEEDQHLQRMIEYTGDIFPSDMIRESSRGDNFFDESGNFRHIQSLHPVPIERALHHYRTVPKSEIEGTARFIQRCLTLDPRKRATAKDLLSDPWLLE